MRSSYEEPANELIAAATAERRDTITLRQKQNRQQMKIIQALFGGDEPGARCNRKTGSSSSRRARPGRANERSSCSAARTNVSLAQLLQTKTTKNRCRPCSTKEERERERERARTLEQMERKRMLHQKRKERQTRSIIPFTAGTGTSIYAVGATGRTPKISASRRQGTFVPNGRSV